MWAKKAFLAAAGLVCLAPGAAAAEHTTLQLSKADCRRLVEHQPNGDIAYREGVDLRGRPVVPADLPGRPKLPLPEDYVFDIEIRPFDFLERRRLGEDPELIADALSENATTLTLGRAMVRRDGRAYFNGVALHDEAQWALVRGCRDALGADAE